MRYRIVWFLCITSVLVLFISCNQKVYEPSKYLVQENVFLKPNFSRLAKIVKIDNEEVFLFLDKTERMICSFNIERNIYDTLVKRTPQRVLNITYDECTNTLWVMLWDTKLWNSKTQKEYDCPLCDNNGMLCKWLSTSGHKPFAVHNDTIYTGLETVESFQTPYHEILPLYHNGHKIAVWKYETDTIRFLYTMGDNPSDQPDFYVDGAYQTGLDFDNSTIVVATELSQDVFVMNLNGEKLREKKISSALYQKPEEKSFHDNHSAAEKMKYWDNNNMFRGIYYDKYRHLYYRVLWLSKKTDKDALTTKQIADRVLMVADSNLNKKYEVFFDGEQYRTGLFISEKGVYIGKKDSMDIFVFE